MMLIIDGEYDETDPEDSHVWKEYQKSLGEQSGGGAQSLQGGMQNLQAGQVDLGISSSAVGSREELQRMLGSYTSRSRLIQGARRQKAIYTIDRFDGGINQNKSPRDLAYWEACQMDELAPSKVGRLIRLGEFVNTDYAIELAGAEQENYGLHYFKWSDSITDSSDTLALASGSPTNYLAYDSGDGGIDLWNFTTGDEVSSIINVVFTDATCDYDDDPTIAHDDDSGAIQVGMFVSGTGIPAGAYVASVTSVTSFELSASTTSGAVTNGTLTFNPINTSFKPVYHSSDNRLYVSDASFLSIKTYMCGIIDRPRLFPYTDGTSVSYNISGTTASKIITSKNLYHAAPIKGHDAGEINVSSNTNCISRAAGGSNGIYINIAFADITAENLESIGWGGPSNAVPNNIKYYQIYASFLYDNGSETKLTGVSDVSINGNDETIDTITVTTDSSTNYQKLIVKQVYIDATEFRTNFPRVHGARFYYLETNSAGASIGHDKYCWAELDFKRGFKVMTEESIWNVFLEINDSDGYSTDETSIQVLNANNNGTDTAGDGTLALLDPPTLYSYYALNLYNPEELKDDLLWKVSAMGNGIVFIGNLKYDGREYPDAMLFSGAGETDAGSAYPMYGTFPVDSNRIDIPGSKGAITALIWVSNKVLQFRQNALYVIDVQDVLNPNILGVYQGMGVHGQWAVTPTSYGVAWVNSDGAYAYNSDSGRVRSLTIGRLDTEDFGADSTSKIGFDNRAKMLIIGNYTQKATDGYHYAYSFVTDSWCTWNINANTLNSVSNFAIDHDGYLTGGTRASSNINIKKWSVQAQTAVAVDYISKDIDFGTPNLDKRLHTLYISYTGGVSQENMYVYFRINGMKGSELTDGWTQLKTIQDYTDPYGSTNGTAWGGSDGSPTSGNPTIVTDPHLDSQDQVASV